MSGDIQDINQLLYDASSARMQGRLDKAVELFQKALDCSPDQPRVLNALGAVLTEKGDFDMAEKYLEKARNVAGESASVLYNLGRLRQVQGRPDEAVRLYEKVVKLEPSMCVAWNNLGSLMLDAGMTGKAVNMLEQAVECAPGMAVAWNNLGVAREKADMPGRAEEAFRMAISLDADYVSALFNLGSLLLREGRRGDAEVLLEKVVRLEPGNVTASFLLKTIDGSGAPDAAPAEYVRRLFDDAAMDFDSTLVEKLEYRTPELMFRMVEPFLTKGMRILDLGCGTGLGAGMYRPYASFLAGVDISGRMLEIAAGKKVYDELFQFDLGGKWPVEKKFDIIYSSDVFVYFGRLSGLLGQMAEHLEPGGIAVFSVEKMDRSGEGDFSLGPGGRYTHAPSFVEKEAWRCGFAVVESAEEILRKEAGKSVRGMIFVLKRQEKNLL